MRLSPASNTTVLTTASDSTMATMLPATPPPITPTRKFELLATGDILNYRNILSGYAYLTC